MTLRADASGRRLRSIGAAYVGPPGPRVYLLFALVAAAVAALSLTYRPTPTFDPWSWLVWGREILHGRLSLLYGPSWKPLPVMFTTVFALAGSAAPNLWLLVARAGLVFSVLMLFRLGARVVWRFGGGTSAAPALLAAMIAGLGYALAPHVSVGSAMGNSEGLLTAAALVSVDLASVGRHRGAFAVASAIALDRPEICAFWVPYGLWISWRDPGARVMVWTLFAGVIVLWLVPQRLGSGSFISAVTRAQNLHPRAISGAACPFCKDLTKVAWHQVPNPLSYPALVSIPLGLLTAVRLGRAGSGLSSAAVRDRLVMGWGLMAAGGFAWWLLIALESEFNFSGSSRYMMIGTIFVYLAGAIAYGFVAVLGVEMLAGRSLRSAGTPRFSVALVTCSAALVFLATTGWITHRAGLTSPSRILRRIRYQGQLRLDLKHLLVRAGGVSKLSCGQILVEYYQSPMAAWYFKRRISQINVEQPAATSSGRGLQVKPGTWPRVVIQDAAVPAFSVRPTSATIRRWESVARHPYRVFQGQHMTLYTDCA